MHGPTVAPPLTDQPVTSSSFVIAEWRDPGSPPGPPRYIAPWHLHHNDDEAWYVVEGVLRIQRDNEQIELNAGSAAIVSRGTPHTYWNPNATPTRYVLIMTPKIHQLIQAIHAASHRSPSALSALFAHYDSELLPSPSFL